MTRKTVTTVRKEWDIGKVLRWHRRIVRAADAYTRREIPWNNYADVADCFGDCYRVLAGHMPGMRIGNTR